MASDFADPRRPNVSSGPPRVKLEYNQLIQLASKSEDDKKEKDTPEGFNFITTHFQNCQNSRAARALSLDLTFCKFANFCKIYKMFKFKQRLPFDPLIFFLYP